MVATVLLSIVFHFISELRHQFERFSFRATAQYISIPYQISHENEHQWQNIYIFYLIRLHLLAIRMCVCVRVSVPASNELLIFFIVTSIAAKFSYKITCSTYICTDFFLYAEKKNQQKFISI